MGLLGSIFKLVALRNLRKNIERAEAGDSKAQHALGWTNTQGKYVPQNDAEAVKWYRKAAEQGHRGAQLNLGTLLAKGQGVKQDLTEAYKWVALAKRPGPSGGHFVGDAATQYLPRLMTLMTPDQIASEQKLVDSFQEDFVFKILTSGPGKYTLLQSVIYNHRGVAESLLAQGADVNEKNSDGLTPLHYAAARGYKTMVELLLKNNANVNATARDGVTPLHLAAAAGHMDVSKILLAKGADTNVRTSKDRNTPSQLAALGGHKNVIELLNQPNDP